MVEGIHICTDGSGGGTPGCGGYGYTANGPDGDYEFCGGNPDTNSQRMEITAVLAALETTPQGAIIDLVSDSQFVVDAINHGLVQWRSSGWRNAQSKLIKNRDLWVKISDLMNTRTVSAQWVNREAEHPGNKRAHDLAEIGRQKTARKYAPSRALSS